MSNPYEVAAVMALDLVREMDRKNPPKEKSCLRCRSLARRGSNYCATCWKSIAFWKGANHV
jgi:hypothetical protein